MKGTPHVLIIGGYGEFGGRLARLLLRDGLKIIVAGRNFNKAQQFCNANGGKPLKLDIATDLHLIDSLNVDVVVDAAGPFQSYGKNEQRYRLARKALECDAHYLDLSDDGEFSHGISCLDSIAKQQQRFVLSGVSSTPALSGAAVTALQNNLTTIDKIETSILPGCRAPQGRSVMLAILDQVGNQIPIWRDCAWEDHIGWSNPAPKRIGKAINRNANLINAADAVLFPQHFNAKSVLFRAGLAMPVMHLSLQWLGSLRSLGLLPNLTRFASTLRWLADRLTPFGSDNGGMLVEVIGESSNALLAKNGSADEAPSHKTQENAALAIQAKLNRSTNDEVSLAEPSDQPLIIANIWQLSAQPGQGPFVPTIAARAILRDMHLIPFGARACIGELSLDSYVDAMDDLDIVTSSYTKAFNYLFANVLGDRWHTLPESVRNTHRVIDKKTLKGYAEINRGTSWITDLIARIFRFPAAAKRISVEVTKTRSAESEVWVRNFNGQQFKSTLSSVVAYPQQSTETLIQEQFGLLKFKLRLEVDGNGLHFPVVSGSCLGIPIPKIILPISNAREFEKDNAMHFCVELHAPLKLGLIVRYEGWLI